MALIISNQYVYQQVNYLWLAKDPNMLSTSIPKSDS